VVRTGQTDCEVDGTLGSGVADAGACCCCFCCCFCSAGALLAEVAEARGRDRLT